VTLIFFLIRDSIRVNVIVLLVFLSRVQWSWDTTTGIWVSSKSCFNFSDTLSFWVIKHDYLSIQILRWSRVWCSVNIMAIRVNF
jgi:hypothetical protein